MLTRVVSSIRNFAQQKLWKADKFKFRVGKFEKGRRNYSDELRREKFPLYIVTSEDYYSNGV
jgi:hypothetical protein